MVFPVVTYCCEIWTKKKAECQRIDVFQLCWRTLFRVPWSARRSIQAILKEINPEYLLEGLILKLQYVGHLYYEPSLEKKNKTKPWCWERLKAKGEEDSREWDGLTVSLTQWQELEQTLGDSGGHGNWGLLWWLRW